MKHVRKLLSKWIFLRVKHISQYFHPRLLRHAVWDGTIYSRVNYYKNDEVTEVKTIHLIWERNRFNDNMY